MTTDPTAAAQDAREKLARLLEESAPLVCGFRCQREMTPANEGASHLATADAILAAGYRLDPQPGPSASSGPSIDPETHRDAVNRMERGEAQLAELLDNPEANARRKTEIHAVLCAVDQLLHELIAEGGERAKLANALHDRVHDASFWFVTRGGETGPSGAGEGWREITHAEAEAEAGTTLVGSNFPVSGTLAACNAIGRRRHPEPANGGWREIGSAPSEIGSRVIGWCTFPAGAEPREIMLMKSGWRGHGVVQHVTHWMPLPAPPSEPAA